MPYQVELSPRAEQQVKALRNVHRTRYDEFLKDLRTRGCSAMEYRLTGEEPIGRLCVRHLKGVGRVVVAFAGDGLIWIVAIGPHDDHDAAMNVYTQLYELAGVPIPAGKRSKPKCCDAETGQPPELDVEVVDSLVAQAKQLTGAGRRRVARRGRVG